VLPLSTSESANKRQLLRSFAALSDVDKQTVLAFVEFLAQRNQAGEQLDASVVTEPAPTTPQAIPRPATESVVAAMRRLSKTYPMLNKDELLHQASGLMSEHILQGKAAASVVDELESLFADACAKQFGEGRG
jgi:hypothetical protein